MDEIILRIDNVSKMYKLGQIGGTTLRDELQRKMAKLKGQEDPTRQIGAKNFNHGETFMALNGVTFDVRKGERVGIIGHNGAGKSTLLKLISRVTAPTGGKIQMNGRVASMLEVGTGFHPELTGRENIYMNGAILGMTKKEIDAKMDDIIEFSEVRQFIDTPVKRYSSGMYVKLAFSVAAHLDSEIMIMDEVLAVGDMAFQKKCLDRMRAVSELDGRTVLYVSHNMNTIRQLCDRVVVLDHGKVAFDGDVEEGIDVYLGISSLGALSYEYSTVQRNRKQNDKCRLLGIEILERDTNIIRRGDPLLVRLHCEVNSDMDDLRFRFEMVNNEGVTIGSSLTSTGISVFSGTYIDVDLQIETINFAPGNFHAIALPYEYDKSGNQIHTDRVDPAFYIKIISHEDDYLIWESRYWGSIYLHETTIKSMKTVS